MKKVCVNFWAWSNICTDMKKGIVNGWNRCTSYDYGNAYSCLVDELETDNKKVYYFVGEEIAQTEKAVCFSVPCFSFNSRSIVTAEYNWKIWIPKKCIVENDNFYYKRWN